MAFVQKKTPMAAGLIGRYLMLGGFLCLPFASRSALADDEVALRTSFTKEFSDKKPGKRIEAVKTLAGVQEEKSVVLLAAALKDPSPDVRKAAAETLEGVSDGAGAATKPLCNILANKKEDTKLRFAAAKALSKGSYKSDPIKAFIIAITIDESEFALYDFGTDCVKLLNTLGGQDFGISKETPDLWKKWYTENQKKLLQDDQATLAAYKKAAAGKGK